MGIKKEIQCNYVVTAMKTEASGTACLGYIQQVIQLALDSNFPKIL